MNAPTIRGRIQPERIAEILSWPWHRRFRYLRILRHLVS